MQSKKLRSQSYKSDEINDSILDLEDRTNEVGSNKKCSEKSKGKSSEQKPNTITTGKRKTPSTEKSSTVGGQKTTTHSSATAGSTISIEADIHSQRDDKIMTLLNAIQNNQKTQGEKIAKLSAKMTEWENYDYTYDGTNDEEQIEVQTEVDNDVSEGEIEEPPAKKQKGDADNNNNEKEKSRFVSMAARCKTAESCDKEIDGVLANNIDELFRNGMNEKQYEDLLKHENTNRPQNCESLSVVKTNQLVWDILSPETRTSDKKLQNVELSVVKGATILAKVVNRIAELDQNEENDKLIEMCNDSLAMLGHANYQINMTRREFIKPEMRYDYVHLCASSVPYTKWLFGDNVSKTAKEIEDCSKIGYKIQYNKGGYTSRGRISNRGRGRGRFRGRGRGYPSSSTHYSQVSNRGAAKNFRRGTYSHQRGRY